MTLAADPAPEVVAEAIRQACPGAVVEVGAVRHLSAGASRRTLAVDVRVDGRPDPMVLQVDADGRPGGGEWPVLAVAAQAQILLRAASAGVPVAPLVGADGAGGALGAPWLLTRAVSGETLPRRIMRDPALAGARERFASDCGRILAGVHRLEVGDLDLPADDALLALRRSLDEAAEPRPAFELAWSWLAAHRPAPSPPALVHGDFRLGNLIVDPAGVRAVLDWELAHVGDPLEDLGWLCSVAWRFGAGAPVGGLGRREELYAAYADAGGTEVDPVAARWWEIRASLAWGAICMRQARRHLHGTSRSMELAAIGRRVCESEWNLLGLLPPPGSAALADSPALPGSPAPADSTALPGADPTGGLHGRPSAAELLEAVAEWLGVDIAPIAGEDRRFHVRVATHVLQTVGRELDLGPAQLARHRARLATLGYADDAALAAAVRAGELPEEEAPALRRVIEAGVRDRLEVANPRYLDHPRPSS